jgi:hypothetical protein
MQKRVIVLVAILCAALLATVLLIDHSAKEPEYNGQPLHFWVLALVQDHNADARKDVRDALHEMDTNALPFLLKWIQYEPARWRYTLAGRIRNLPPQRICIPLGSYIASDRRDELALGAGIVLARLGPKAAPATDTLARMMNDTAANLTSIRATRVLGNIGTNSINCIQALLKVAQNPQHPRSSDARFALAKTFGVRGIPNEYPPTNPR